MVSEVVSAVEASRRSPPRHPRGSRARVLLVSVFGPYARDDEYGSRRLNPMELYENQVTRAQGPFSLRMFHRSWGLMMIQANLDAPVTVLDFPTLDRFVEELRSGDYDVVGIGAIIPNVAKVEKMCALVREHRPGATIVVGGHVANVPDLHRRIDADHIVRGEGIAWFREFLGEDPERPIRHPAVLSGLDTRILGVNLREKAGSTAATLIPSVGCPLGCNFCCTSAMFGGKGKSVNFYRTGDELFEVMAGLEAAMGVNSFFVMDENFLLDRKRALRLLDLMREGDRAWGLQIFSSANALLRYRVEELVELGVSWVWMGLEGKDSGYRKLDGVDAPGLVRTLKANGIRVLGSTIIGFPEHTPENMDEVIDHGVRYDTDFHQFMLYMPVPGTPLWDEMKEEGVLRSEAEVPWADAHGQSVFNYRHPHLPAGAETEILLRAFQRDFAANGPSIARIVRTTLAGWMRHRAHPDARVRRRIARDSESLATNYAAVIGACRRTFRKDPVLGPKMDALGADLAREFGWKARAWGRVGGLVISHLLRREAKRLARGWTREPRTYCEHNDAAARIDGRSRALLCSSVPSRAPIPGA